MRRGMEAEAVVAAHGLLAAMGKRVRRDESLARIRAARELV